MLQYVKFLMLVLSVLCHSDVCYVRTKVIQQHLQWIGKYITSLCALYIALYYVCLFTCFVKAWHDSIVLLLWANTCSRNTHVQVWENQRHIWCSPIQVILWLMCHMGTFANWPNKTYEYSTHMCKLSHVHTKATCVLNIKQYVEPRIIVYCITP